MDLIYLIFGKRF